jgi:hypothetical protein
MKRILSMLNAFTGGVMVTDEAIEQQFVCYVIDHPVRCASCNKMYPSGHKFAWLPSSAAFFKNANTRDELSVISRQSCGGKSGWCIGCVKSLPN